MKNKIAIDLGSSYTKIYKSQADVVLYEPTCVAIEKNNYSSPIAYGYEAEKLIGKTNNNVKIIYPVKGVEIVDEKALKALIVEYISRVRTTFEFKPDILFSVSCGATRESIKNFERVFNLAGYYNVDYAESASLAMIGANGPHDDASTSFIIDLGSSQTIVCALTMQGVISGVSAEYGGNTLNGLIVNQLRGELNFSISHNQAEILKVAIASLKEEDGTKTIVYGKDASSSKPKTMQVSSQDIYSSVKTFTDKIIEIANIILTSLKEETILDIHNNGILLVGGGSLIYGIKDYLENALSFKVVIPKESEIVCSIGGGIVIEDKALYNKIKMKV